MKKNATILAILGIIALISGCVGARQEITTGIKITNELSSKQMQAGGTVQLRTSVNNFFDNPLKYPKAKLVRSFGELTYSPPGEASLGAEVQDNPNATARATWTIRVSKSATPGTAYKNRVRLCFQYTQTAWHEIGLVNSFDIETEVNQGADTGPAAITFSGLDKSFIRNEQISAEIPVSISIQNAYTGRFGPMNLPGDAVANITKVTIRIYDRNLKVGNISPQEVLCGDGEDNDGDGLIDDADPDCAVERAGTFDILEEYNSPVRDPRKPLEAGDLVCNNSQLDPNTGYPVSYNAEERYYECYIENMTVFGKETFINTRLNVTNLLSSEEVIEKIEVEATYDYCVESDEFELTVFKPGG